MATAPKPAETKASEPAPAPASAPVEAAPYEMPKTYTADEVKKHRGELKAGEHGWVKLDEHGCPTGAATKEPPKDGPAIRVMAKEPVSVSELTTSTGAPITENMNPSLPQPYHDEGMKARNPAPGSAPY